MNKTGKNLKNLYIKDSLQFINSR